MWDMMRSGIRGDTRKCYYYKVEKFFNINVMQLSIGEVYGNKSVNMLLVDLVCWDRVVKHDGMGGDQLGICIRGQRTEHITII